MLMSVFFCVVAQVVFSSKNLVHAFEANGTNVKSGSESSSCEYPQIYSAFFDNENRVPQGPPELQFINSTKALSKAFPYQYILMTCSAPYPIEWISEDVPQHYYFSYILDDEIRSIVNVGVNQASNQQAVDAANNGKQQSEIFTIRLHVGNETLSKTSLATNVSIICQPVADGGCGITVASLQNYKDGLAGNNKAMLRMQFSQIPLEPTNKENEKPLDLKNGTNSCNGRDTREKVQCNHTWAGQNDFSKMLKQPNLNEDKDEKCDIDNNLLLKMNKTNLTRPSGIITCSKWDEEGHTTTQIPYLFSLPNLCPNEDITLPHLYFGKSISSFTTAMEATFMSLCVQNASTSDIYVGDTVVVTCISSIYYFAQGMQITLVHGNQKSTLGDRLSEKAFGLGGYRNLTTTFTIDSTDIYKVKCSAPVRKSRKWALKTVLFQPREAVKVAFLPTPDTAVSDASGASFLNCNASGDPIPRLVWSRLSKEQLPTNQTTIERQAGNSSSWASSTLHFPNVPASNLSKYYGRYICTASNKFDSIEKVFLFDDKSNQDAATAFGGNVFTKTPWFWIIVAPPMLTLVLTVAWLGWKVRKQAKSSGLFSKAEVDEFLLGKPELLLDDTEMYTEMNSYAAYLPYDTHQFEIPREHLEFNPVNILGTGAYGTVYYGTFKSSYGKTTPVAIKTVNPSSDKMYFAALLSEIKIMCYIGKHENVVQLIGACTKYLDQRQLFVATEYCPNGDLLSYVLKHRDTFIHNSTHATQKNSLQHVVNRTEGSNGYCKLTYSKLLLSPHLLLVWSLQIAQGMNYLSSKKVIHGDLAARNILLAGDLKPKIADFGLSKQLQKYANYVKKGDDLVPWRWLAVECLQFMKFSIQSDVWAFGVVLFELWSLGEVPYGSHAYTELFIVSLCQGERLKKPAFACDKL